MLVTSCFGFFVAISPHLDHKAWLKSSKAIVLMWGLYVCVCSLQMSEDLAKQLASYKAQLQQVEAALSGNADNEDLLKLKKDLQVRTWG